VVGAVIVDMNQLNTRPLTFDGPDPSHEANWG